MHVSWDLISYEVLKDCEGRKVRSKHRKTFKVISVYALVHLIINSVISRSCLHYRGGLGFGRSGAGGA